MKHIILLIFGLTILMSCKKKTSEIDISGTLFDPNAGEYIVGAVVSVQATGIVDGIYNAGYTTITSGTTDQNGQFSFIIDESAYDSFRFTFIKDGYYITQEIHSASNIDPEHPFSKTFNFYTKSYIKLNVKNIYPFDDQDKISIYFQNPPSTCPECCSADAIQMTGMNIDTVINCTSYGNYYLILSYSYTKNNNTHIFNDTLLTQAFDTTYHSVHF